MESVRELLNNEQKKKTKKVEKEKENSNWCNLKLTKATKLLQQKNQENNNQDKYDLNLQLMQLGTCKMSGFLFQEKWILFFSRDLIRELSQKVSAWTTVFNQ